MHLSAGRPFHLDFFRLVPWLVGFLPPLASPFVPLPWRLLLLVPLAVVVVLPQQRRRDSAATSGTSGEGIHHPGQAPA